MFLAGSSAPVADVATAAGVGISALYHRNDGREDMVRTRCRNGLVEFIAIARHAQAIDDPWDALVAFMTGVVRADLHGLTVHLAGTFTPTEDLNLLAAEAATIGEAIFVRAQQAGALRPALHATDLTMVFEQLAAIRIPHDEPRTAELRDRYLVVHLEGLAGRPNAAPLP